MYFNMNITTYFRVSLKMQKPMLCCCFNWIVFIKLDFAVPFLSTGKTQDDGFAGKGGMGDFKKWRQILVMEDDFEMGG